MHFNGISYVLGTLGNISMNMALLLGEMRSCTQLRGRPGQESHMGSEHPGLFTLGAGTLPSPPPMEKY